MLQVYNGGGGASYSEVDMHIAQSENQALQNAWGCFRASCVSFGDASSVQAFTKALRTDNAEKSGTGGVVAGVAVIGVALAALFIMSRSSSSDDDSALLQHQLVAPNDER